MRILDGLLDEDGDPERAPCTKRHLNSFRIDMESPKLVQSIVETRVLLRIPILCLPRHTKVRRRGAFAIVIG